MDNTRKEMIQNERDMYVVKANQLIRQSKYTLSLQELRVLAYLVMKIQYNDLPGTEYTIDIRQLAQLYGVSFGSNKKSYFYIKNAIKALRDKSVWIWDENTKTEKLISFISEVEMSPNTGRLKIKFSSGMEYLLFALSNNYTQFKLNDVLALKTKYAFRLYELLRSYASDGALKSENEIEVKFKFDQLCYSIGAIRETKNGYTLLYTKYSDLWRFALKPAIDDINEVGPVKINCMTEKQGKSVVNIIFVVNRLTYKEMQNRDMERARRLAYLPPSMNKEYPSYSEYYPAFEG